MKRIWGSGLLMAIIVAALPAQASAHQPFFEDHDYTQNAPYVVKDPTISTALYATLATPTDVDYAVFEGKRGQDILIGLTIPRIAGQENFSPTLALIGPGLPAAALPAAVAAPAGAVILRAPTGPAPIFNEPFSRTSYWERQQQVFRLPADGHYAVAVWDEHGQVGRYTLVVGDREVIGGDPLFPIKLRSFWAPVPAGTNQSQHCSGHS